MTIYLKQCRQEVLLLGNEVAYNEAIIDERDQGIRDVQLDIAQSNEIFRDLAVLVHNQRAVIGETLIVQLKNIFFCFIC